MELWSLLPPLITFVACRNVSKCVKDQIIKDRNEKIRERERQKKLYSYHRVILQKGRLPPITDENETKTGTIGSNYETHSLQSFGRLSLETRALASTTKSGKSTPDFNRIRQDELVRMAEASGQSDKMAPSHILKGSLKQGFFNRSVSVSAMSIPSELVYYGHPTEAGSSTGSSRPTPLQKKANILSMSQPLGSKPKPSGAVKKKRKRKTKRR